MREADVFWSLLLSLAAILAVSELWLVRIHMSRMRVLPVGFLQQASSFQADFHLTVGALSLGLVAACLLMLRRDIDEHSLPYLMWAIWCASWLWFSARRWMWLTHHPMRGVDERT